MTTENVHALCDCGAMTPSSARYGHSHLAWCRYLVHGVTCQKKPHDNPAGGYLHGDDDDTPYDVDGWSYCGRCHQVLS